MKRTIYSIIPILGLLMFSFSLTSVAQVPNEGIANMIIQARQKNSAQLKQYTRRTVYEYSNQ
jgi:hypothetical protein